MQDQPETRIKEVRDPLPGGILAPGEAIVIPRMFVLRADHAKDTASIIRQLIDDKNVASGFALIHFDHPREYDIDKQEFVALNVPAESVVLPRQHIFVGVPGVKLYGDGRRRPLDHDQREIFIVGEGVMRIDVGVNRTLIPTREDKGVALAILGGQEWGSCPFLFVTDELGYPERNLGHVIADRIGKDGEGSSFTPIPPGTAKFIIRELEPETTYINYASLRVVKNNGTKHTYVANQDDIKMNDFDYMMIQTGESKEILFPDYIPDSTDRAVTIEISGYYEPRAAVRAVNRQLFRGTLRQALK